MFERWFIWAVIKPPAWFWLDRIILASYIGIINHEIRIPIFTNQYLMVPVTGGFWSLVISFLNSAYLFAFMLAFQERVYYLEDYPIE